MGSIELINSGHENKFQYCYMLFRIDIKHVNYNITNINEFIIENETIYCELVQWCEDCISGECTILAQYLGALNDVLFPPNMCSNDGVDLLMRRCKDFPVISIFCFISC